MQAGDLLRQFSRRFRAHTGHDYPPTWGRDIKIFKKLLVSDPKGHNLTSAIGLYFDNYPGPYSPVYFAAEYSTILQNIPSSARADDNESWRFE